MYLQTQPTPVFTVFGSYVLERQGDYFPVRSNGQDRWDTENMESTYALLAAARQQINLQ